MQIKSDSELRVFNFNNIFRSRLQDIEDFLEKCGLPRDSWKSFLPLATKSGVQVEFNHNTLEKCFTLNNTLSLAARQHALQAAILHTIMESGDLHSFIMGMSYQNNDDIIHLPTFEKKRNIAKQIRKGKSKKNKFGHLRLIISALYREFGTPKTADFLKMLKKEQDVRDFLEKNSDFDFSDFSINFDDEKRRLR